MGHGLAIQQRGEVHEAAIFELHWADVGFTVLRGL
jgi:hypothetical protein